MTCDGCGALIMVDGFGTAREVESGRLHSCRTYEVSLTENRFLDRVVNIDQEPAALSAAMQTYADHGLQRLETWAWLQAA